MSIAISTSPANAISSLADLVLEVRDEMDDDGFAQDRIYRAVGRAEARFNRDLRHPKMETDILFVASGEITDLPNDFLQMRHIYQEGTPDNPLRAYSPGQLRGAFYGISGTPVAYAIENRRLMIGPVGETQLQMTYYQRIPALTDSNPTNWLLDENPDVYLHQVLAILFNKTGDSERSALNMSIANDLIDEVQRASASARWGAGPLYPRRSTSVRGVHV